MHICIVAPGQLTVPPTMGGSVEICIHAIARQLAKEHDVTIISRRHPRLPNEQREGRITYLRVRTGSSSFYLANVLGALRNGSYDVIQVDNRPTYAAAIKKALPHKPVSLFLHSLTFVTAPMISRERASACLDKPDFIIANSSSLYEALGLRFPRCRSKLRKVLLGVDVNRFRPPTAEEKKKAKQRFGTGGSFTVLFAGRVIPRKGIPVLLKAIRLVRRSVPRAKLIIAGGGKSGYVKRLKQQAMKLGVPAVFTGLLAHKSIHRVYQAADCFVCPSQKHEAFGLVNVEAMATGVPVVASKIGGIGEIVKNDRNGYLIEAFRDAEAFAQSITLIAQQRAHARQLSEQARADAVERFGWDSTAKTLSEIYSEHKSVHVSMFAVKDTIRDSDIQEGYRDEENSVYPVHS